ncbi:MAG: polysaccharide deacetylase family protein [Minisyncoccota bacterium]
MLSFRQKKILIAALLLAAVVAGALFFLRSSPGFAKTSFQTDQARYAELPSEATPSPAIASSSEQARIPILAYHIVRPSYPSDSQAVKALALTPETFDAQMKYLADAGYHVVPMRALEDYFKNGTPLPRNPIILSFDDGWSDQFTYAFPILQKYHYTATFFVFTNSIGRRGFLTWEDLHTLRDAGMTIASHSRSHPFLTKIADPATLWSEIDGSKQILEKNLGITVNEFAYPFGQYNPEIVAMVKKAGYTVARGDYVQRGGEQSLDQLYALSALNAPTTMEKFMRKFPRN